MIPSIVLEQWQTIITFIFGGGIIATGIAIAVIDWWDKAEKRR